MDSKHPIFKLYEKLYFHEIEMREKLSARLQIPLALILSLTGLLAFMLQNFERSLSNMASIFFVVFLVLSAFALAASVYYFVRSWFGHTYSFLPSAQDTENYRQELYKTYDPYEDGKATADGHFDEFLCLYMIRLSSINTQCNDKRSIYLHKTNASLIIVASLALVSFLIFYFGDLDKGRQSKPLEVKIIQPLDVQGAFMSDKKPELPKKINPPQPPPPPPPRQIREGVEIIIPDKEKKDGK